MLNMKKPTLSELPHSVYEEMLWEMDALDYDGYESSRAECIHDIMNENVSRRNSELISSYYERLTAEEVHTKMSNKLDNLNNQSNYIRECMFNCVYP